MSNITYDQPPLPTFSLKREPDLFSFVSDKTLGLALPITVYVVLSLFWQWVDAQGLWSEYQLHPTEEMLKRNRVSKLECLKGVALYHITQLAATIALTWSDDGATYSGDENYSIALWASRLREAQRLIPASLSVLGVDSVGLAGKVAGFQPSLAGLLRGGLYPEIKQTISILPGKDIVVPAFASWEIKLATLVYYVGIPFAQFMAAFFIADTWFYFLHRLFHQNKWLYKKLHATHHRLYITYAFGAVYAHPLEGLIIDTMAFTLGIVLTGMTARQTMVFNFIAVWKAMSDHCGYVLPWDPFTHITGNNSKYHDVHHQTWGLKNNFAIYFTFWDRLLGSSKTYEDHERRHEKNVKAAKIELKTEYPEVAAQVGQ
ncbi:MAG: hypothetical protein M1825_005781 [Sarcosagium campestre]|nr:MAG: hypothetical protein M1825_005781 [Sarcosagium campestre]